MSIAVIYLAWHGAGPSALRRFAESHDRHPAGVPYRLYVLPKEYPGAVPFRSGGIVTVLPHLPGTVFDIPAYFHAARQVTEDAVCFLNSNSEILADDWLAKLHGGLERADCIKPSGICAAGACGSFERWPHPDWPPFPNAHLRTNAFMMRRREFLNLPNKLDLTATKEDCWAWESGPRGLPRMLLEMQARAVAVGADGTVYEQTDWPRSGTFRQGEQENLLVADNQTRRYRDAPPAEREYLRALAWGEYGAAEAREERSGTFEVPYRRNGADALAGVGG